MQLSVLASLPILFTSAVLAQQPGEDTPLNETEYRRCLTLMAQTADANMTLGQLRESCKTLSQGSVEQRSAKLKTEPTTNPASEPLQKRIEMEALNRSNRFLLTPHNRNYVLPANYTDRPNAAPFEQAAQRDINLQNTELEFQISMKVLIAQDLLHNNGNLYIAYTNRSFWQAYNTGISRPFRETNHEPELILSVMNDWEFFGFRNVLNQLSLVHQSNGQSGDLSRSWNRIKGNIVFERDHIAFSLSPWYRLPEDKEDDDNPDIEDYYGHYELRGAYTRNDQIVSFMTRRPFTRKGALELDWSFPISSTVRGYIKLFDGYGASLIDYDVRTQSIGLGVTFTDIF